MDSELITTEEYFHSAQAAYHYDELAQKHHWLGPYFAAQAVQHYASRLGITVDEILDDGGGTGLAAGLLKRNYPNAHVTIIDISRQMLLVAEENHRADTYVQGDARRLSSFKKGQFAVAVLVGLLNYFEKSEAETVLKEAARVVRSGGLVVGTCAMDTYGRLPTHIAHVTHSERHILTSLSPHWICQSKSEMTRIKHDRQIEETVFAAWVRHP